MAARAAVEAAAAAAASPAPVPAHSMRSTPDFTARIAAGGGDAARVASEAELLIANGRRRIEHFGLTGRIPSYERRGVALRAGEPSSELTLMLSRQHAVQRQREREARAAAEVRRVIAEERDKWTLPEGRKLPFSPMFSRRN